MKEQTSLFYWQHYRTRYPGLLLISFFALCKLKDSGVKVTGSMFALKVADIIWLKETNVARLAGSVVTTIGQIPSTSSKSSSLHPVNKTASAIAMLANTLLGFIFMDLNVKAFSPGKVAPVIKGKHYKIWRLTYIIHTIVKMQ